MNKYENDIWEEIKSGSRNSDANRRVFGISKDVGESISIALARRAHNGVDWKNLSEKKRQDNFRNQLHGGRALELVVCEALITGKFSGFHFLPPKELDLYNKIDLVSRMPYIGKGELGGTRLKTFSIGTQLTMMELPENIEGTHREANMKRAKYREKIEQVRSMTKFLHIPLTRRELKEKFGKLTLPDIMAFVAVNGELRKTLGNQSNYLLMKYREWEAKGFPTTGVVGEFKPRIRNTIYDVTRFISQTQQYVFSNEFLFKHGASKNKNFKVELEDGKILYDFSVHTGELDCYLYADDNKELLVKITYLFTGDDIPKLASKRRNTNKSHKKYVPTPHHLPPQT